MYHFHQRAIIRRYITNNPKTPCARDLKQYMHNFGKPTPQIWVDDLHKLKQDYRDFLAERNEAGGYKHRLVLSTFRSLENNLPHLFVYHDMSELLIPTTTSQLKGVFAHIKEKHNSIEG